ncbi:TetR family transcriptional regulator [Mycobacteroides abscessus subsp. bolletii]|uniref:TetR/AcrR family transcriptional regulator n=1 Tax=Mycobacteroides abscessus TaxID=36809 RepID=UPI0009D289A1|nr:TetR/AcrR family transcriptional regulator [Mycobacteroides abscessus]SLI54587.1 TetR family transcriptional regulator [Mycobacteroides abscessus subsp. bolletii]
MAISAEHLSDVQARTRAAILAATASALAANRTATMPEIAAAAGVGRTTLHRYFADRETLIYEATLDAIRVVLEAADEAATDDGSALDAMRRFVAAAVSIGERLVFLFGDPSVLRDIRPVQAPTFELVLNLITRGQHEGVFDPDLSPIWIRHALYGLILQGCEQAMVGALPRHTVAPLIIRTFERGICPAP